MKIKIDSLNHEEYLKLIDYIGKAEKISKNEVGGIKEKSIYEINIKNINGNPPEYLNMTISFPKQVSEQFPQDKEVIKKSLKGLIDLLPIK